MWPTVAMVRPLAWELPYAAGAALKRQEKKKKGAVSFCPPGVYERTHYSTPVSYLILGLINCFFVNLESGKYLLLIHKFPEYCVRCL